MQIFRQVTDLARSYAQYPVIEGMRMDFGAGLGTDPTGRDVVADLVVVWSSDEQLLAMAPLVEEAPEIFATQFIAFWIR